MSDVIDIFSRRKVKPQDVRRPKASASVSDVARANDIFRQKLDIRNQVIPSFAVRNLPSALIEEMFIKLRTYEYSDLDYGAMPHTFISRVDRAKAEATHSAGLIHIGQNKVHILWSIDRPANRIILQSSKEVPSVFSASSFHQ